MTDFQKEHIWIIGASSGIGEALALELASRGAHLVLSARDSGALEALNQRLGGTHLCCPFDIADAAHTQKVVSILVTSLPRLDRVILLAALYRPGGLDTLDLAFTRHLLEVNLLGAFHLIHAILPLLKAQQHGQIALCGSVAGYTGLPHGQPYSASKAAIANLAESLHAEMQGTGIDVKLISPGFVRTRMTDTNPFPMPFRLEAHDAARRIADGLNRRAFEIHFPKRFTLWLKLLRLLPYSLTLTLTRRFTGS